MGSYQIRGQENPKPWQNAAMLAAAESVTSALSRMQDQTDRLGTFDINQA